MLLRTIIALSTSSSSAMTMSIEASTGNVGARRAAIAQLQSTSNKHANLIHVAKCAGRAKRCGAQMLFLPECLGYMGDTAEQTLKEADPPINVVNRLILDEQSEEVDSWYSMTPFRKLLSQAIENDEYENQQLLAVEITSKSISIIDELRYIAHKSKLWISGGGVHTRTTSVPFLHTSPSTSTNEITASDKIYNTHVIIDDGGQIQAHYNKIHLFDISIPNKVELRESNTTYPGDKLVVCDSPIGKLGLSICYDMRFAEMYVHLVQKMGAQILLMPAAFTVPTGKAHWHTLLRARAIENQCYVIAAAQVGKHNEKRESYGHSLCYDPWGELIADAGGRDGTGSQHNTVPGDLCSKSFLNAPNMVIVDIDLNRLETVRENMPMQMHRDQFRFSD